jgi:hypothetical protein
MPKDDSLANDPLAQVRAMAAVAYAEVGGDYGRATETLKERLRADANLLAAVLEYLIDTQCAQMIRAMAGLERREIARDVRIRQAESEWTLPDNASGGVRALARYRGVLDFPLPGGKKLADATMGDVIEAERFYRTAQRTSKARADFFAKLLERKRETQQLVRDAWAPDELEDVFVATGNG